jgi:hypothetical protein
MGRSYFKLLPGDPITLLTLSSALIDPAIGLAYNDQEELNFSLCEGREELIEEDIGYLRGLFVNHRD